MTASANDWNEYTLQTDHYAVAFIVSGSLFSNPLYFGDGSCDDASSDCSIGIGGGALWVTEASIYLGSTLADVLSAPANASFTQVKNPTGTNYPNTISVSIKKWSTAIFAAVTAVKQFYTSQPSAVSVPVYFESRRGLRVPP